MMFTASTHPLRSRQLDALSYRLPPEVGHWDTVIARFEAARFRGAVVGPHGTGKTTFLMSLQRELEQRGWRVVMLFTNTERGGRLPRAWLEALDQADDQTIVIADGYDVFWRWEKRRLRRRLRPRGGLIVTAHKPIALPTIFETKSSTKVLLELVHVLYEQADAEPPEEQRVRTLLEQCDGNMREVLRRLYVER